MYLVRLTDPMGERSQRWLRRQPADADYGRDIFTAAQFADEGAALRGLAAAKRRCRKLASWRCEVVQQDWGTA